METTNNLVKREAYDSLTRISWEWNFGWKLSESTPLFHRRIVLAEKTKKYRCITFVYNKVKKIEIHT